MRQIHSKATCMTLRCIHFTVTETTNLQLNLMFFKQHQLDFLHSFFLENEAQTSDENTKQCYLTY